MRAYSRDGEATQAHYVARSYLAYYQGDYAGFHQSMTQALDAHPNLPLAYSVCSQFAVFGGVEQGCECFRKYEYMLDGGVADKRTLVQKLLQQKRGNTAAAEFRSEAAAVCAAIRGEEGAAG